MEEEKLKKLRPSIDVPQSFHPPQANRLNHSIGLHQISRNQLLDIVEFLPDATFVVNQDRRVIAWNRAIEEMTRVAKADILGKGDYLYAFPFYGEARPVVIDYAMGMANGIESSYSFLQKEGETCFAETFCPILYGGEGAFLWVKASPLYDSNGRVIGAVESVRDITVRKKAEEALRKSEEKYRQIFQNTPLGIFYFDADGIVQDCNDKIIEIWGSFREKFLGFNLRSSLKNKKMKSAVNTCLSGRYACYEGSYLSVTGGKISILKADFGPVLSLDGSVMGGIGIIEDISDRRKAEAALHESENQFRLIAAKLIAAQEEERRCIARELHDSIGSSLAAIKLSIEGALEMARRGQSPVENLQATTGVIQSALKDSRRIITDLRPSTLDDFGIITTIHWLTRQYESYHSGLTINMQIEIDEEDIPEYLKIVIFRIVQEALQNIAKRRKAGPAGITLEKSGDLLKLRIEDSCLECDPVIQSEEGFLSMKKRSEYSGGKMAIDSLEGVGTFIEASWPLLS